MIYVVLALGVLFFGLGFLLNETNAKYLLSGYNTMSEEEQAKFPIKAYLKKFNAFHKWFGALFTAAGLVLYFVQPYWLGYHLGITPIVAYLGFFWSSRESAGQSKTALWVGVGVLVATLAGVIGLFIWSDSPSALRLDNDTLHISGPYGTEISLEDVRSLALVHELPEIRVRTHGISTERVAKGRFKGKDGNAYLLIIDLPATDILVMERTAGPTVLLSLHDVDEVHWYELLREETGLGE